MHAFREAVSPVDVKATVGISSRLDLHGTASVDHSSCKNVFLHSKACVSGNDKSKCRSRKLCRVEQNKTGDGNLLPVCRQRNCHFLSSKKNGRREEKFYLWQNRLLFHFSAGQIKSLQNGMSSPPPPPSSRLAIWETQNIVRSGETVRGQRSD